MEIVVRGRHVVVSDRFRSHVTEKLARADKFGVPLTRIDVEVSFESNPRQAERANKVELTCLGKGPVIRAEAFAPDGYTALDLAWARLEERLRRAADKKLARRNEKIVLVPDVGPGDLTAVTTEGAGEPAPQGEADDDDAVWTEGPIEVRLKEIEAAPMSVASAVEAMELVGHDFYLFTEIETGFPAVVYRRRGFQYGLIRLDGAAAPAVAGGSDA
ncbi:MAG: ribosome hibernation-promoting factor, HPF/YfiA family [Candidatus Nanopelagicales bacterium]